MEAASFPNPNVLNRQWVPKGPLLLLIEEMLLLSVHSVFQNINLEPNIMASKYVQFLTPPLGPCRSEEGYDSKIFPLPTAFSH